MLSRRNAVIAAVAFAGAGAVLAGCSGGTPGSGSPGATSPGGSTSRGPTTTFNQATNARSDISVPFTCSLEPNGSWTWSGTVTNKGSTRHTYRIIVDFTNLASTVEQTKNATVAGVAAGGTARWSVTGATGLHDIRCVIRSVRITA